MSAPAARVRAHTSTPPSPSPPAAAFQNSPHPAALLAPPAPRPSPAWIACPLSLPAFSCCAPACRAQRVLHLIPSKAPFPCLMAASRRYARPAAAAAAAARADHSPAHARTRTERAAARPPPTPSAPAHLLLGAHGRGRQHGNYVVPGALIGGAHQRTCAAWCCTRGRPRGSTTVVVTEACPVMGFGHCAARAGGVTRASAPYLTRLGARPAPRPPRSSATPNPPADRRPRSRISLPLGGRRRARVSGSRHVKDCPVLPSHQAPGSPQGGAQSGTTPR